MKTIKLTVLLCIAIVTAKSQPYGEKAYNHPSPILSSGFNTTLLSQGFVMGSYRQNSGSTDENFYIDRTDAGGVFTSGTAFQKGYALRHSSGSACTGGLTSVNNCSNVCVIETDLNGPTTASDPNYAVAGVYNRGIFFSCLDAAGTPLTPVAFYFPANVTPVGKIMIANAPALSPPNSRYYTICGSYNDNSTSPVTPHVYVLVVDEGGNPISQNDYDMTNIPAFEARGMTPSLGTAGNVVIVGIVNDGGVVSRNKGFFMEITPGSTAATPATFIAYGQAPTVGKDEFSCITPVGSTGYLIGGYSDVASPNIDWFVKLTNAGAMSWSSIFTSTGVNVKGIVGVTSCLNTSNAVVNYGISYDPTAGTGGIVTMKLDANGNAFGVSNTFKYTLTNLISAPVNITSNMTAPNDRGLHIYGIGDGSSTTANNTYLVEAYLNGIGACNPNNTFGTVGPGPNTQHTGFSGWTNNPTLPNPCFNFLMIDNAVSPALFNTICSANSVTGGSNARGAAATSIEGHGFERNKFEISPNPTRDKTSLSFHQENSGNTKFNLYNGLGQLVKNIENTTQSTGDHSIEISFLGLDAGLYFIDAEIDGEHVSQKIVYDK